MIKFRAFVFISIATSFMYGCDYIVDKTPFNKHEAHEIKFEYPIYWKVTKKRIDEGYEFIAITSPLGSGIFLVINPIDVATALDEYSRLYSESVNESIKDIRVSESTFTPIEDQVGDYSLTGIREAYIAESAGIDIPQRRDYFILYREKDVVYVIIQVGNDFKIVASEIERIKESFEFQGQPNKRMLSDTAESRR